MASKTKSENQGRVSLKSWKLINGETLHLTHDNGVDTFQVKDISEIEFEFSVKERLKSFVDQYLGYGILGIIVFPGIFAFFNWLPNKDYFEEYESYFSFYYFLFCIIFLTPIARGLLGVFSNGCLVENRANGRELNVYSLSKGKSEYQIEDKNLENILTDHFFQILFEKSTNVNKIFNYKNINSNYKNINRDFWFTSDRNRTIPFYDSKKVLVGHLILFFLSASICLISFFCWHLKLELIPLISINLILLLMELMQLIVSIKRVRFWKKYINDSYRFIQIYEDQFQCESDISKKSSKVLYHGRIDDVTFTTRGRSVYLVVGSEEFEVLQHLYWYGDSLNKLFILECKGINYFLNQLKDKGVWLVMYEIE